MSERSMRFIVFFGLGTICILTGFVRTDESCKDRIKCGWIKRNGICASKAPYHYGLIRLCKKTCGLCRPLKKRPTVQVCNDVSNACAALKRRYYCRRSVTYMRAYCKRTCGFCSQNGCTDESQHCPYWYRIGECTRNPRYMLKQCRKSCGVCRIVKPKPRPEPKPRPKPTRRPKTTPAFKGKNIAKGKPTKQSSTAFRGKSSRAVDGNKNTNYASNTCTHTASQRSPWWRVDLGNSNYKVQTVLIVNRGDCCWNRLRNIEIRVGNVDNSPYRNGRCTYHSRPIGKGKTKIFHCERPITGRFVYVLKRALGYLTLCEVEVYVENPEVLKTTEPIPQTPPIPTTAAKPKTTAGPTTTVEPQTPPIPTTADKPKTTAGPTTTVEPQTPPIPTTADKPKTTAGPTTKVEPQTPPKPTTGDKPKTTAGPTTTVEIKTSVPKTPPIPPIPTEGPKTPPIPPIPTEGPKTPPTPPIPTEGPKTPPIPPIPTEGPKTPPTPPIPTEGPKTPIPPIPTDGPNTPPIPPMPNTAITKVPSLPKKGTTKSPPVITSTPPLPVVNTVTKPPLTIPSPMSLLNSILCGKPSKSVIVGGEATERGQYPWMVAVTKVATPKDIWCGATLLSDTWLLSAAHCFSKPTRNNPADYVLRIGEHDIKRDGDEVVGKIQKIILHEKYNKETHDYDIALLRLEKRVKFNRAMRPICIPYTKVNYQPGSKCIVAGWGYDKERRGKFPNLLHAVQVPIIEKSKCKTAFEKLKKAVTPQMMCAGHVEGGKDSCQGDSGGPLICRGSDGGSWEQVGIVSWGVGCARENLYGVYTEVPEMRSWIESKINPFVLP